MKNIQFPSIQTTYKVLAASALLATFAIAGMLAGFFMPIGFNRIDWAPWILAAISLGLFLFVWSIFRLIKPLRYDRNWQVAEYALVPLYWLLLLLTVDLWLGGAVQRSAQRFFEIFNQLP